MTQGVSDRPWQAEVRTAETNRSASRQSEHKELPPGLVHLCDSIWQDVKRELKAQEKIS